MWKYQDYVHTCTHTKTYVYILINKRTHTTVYAWEALTKRKYTSINIHFSNNYEKFKSKGSGWALTFAFVPIAWYEKGTDFLCWVPEKIV